MSPAAPAPIIWINGPFGVGNLKTAAALRERLPGSFLFDPAEMGQALKKLTPNFAGDAQGHPMWIPLMLDALQYAKGQAAGPIIVPVTVSDPARHRRLMGGLRDRGLQVEHFTLMAPLAVIEERLRQEGRQDWEPERLRERLELLGGEQFARHVDISALSLHGAAEEIAAEVGLSLQPPSAPPSPLRWLRAAAEKLGVPLREA